VAFHLGPAASAPFIDGTLHLTWTDNRLPLSERGQAPAVCALEPSKATQRPVQSSRLRAMSRYKLQAAINRFRRPSACRWHKARPSPVCFPPCIDCRRVARFACLPHDLRFQESRCGGARSKPALPPAKRARWSTNSGTLPGDHGAPLDCL